LSDSYGFNILKIERNFFLVFFCHDLIVVKLYMFYNTFGWLITFFSWDYLGNAEQLCTIDKEKYIVNWFFFSHAIDHSGNNVVCYYFQIIITDHGEYLF
jgi:hypothetical protein